MDSPEVLDVSKENIQPLRQGRNPLQLSAALQAQSDTAIHQNLLKKRQEYELLLRTYDGDDPLGIWFEYVEWVEQTFPKDGKEGNLMTLLQNCLTRFKDATKYFQDIRLVKLWIKYLEKLENPIEFYNQLHCHGIGTQCALFYRCWAYELYETGDFKQADKVLLSGIRRYAEPTDELIRAHEKFQIAVARRILDKSLAAPEESAFEEERKVGNILTTFGKKHKVPSVRIGGRVKSGGPGTLHSKENLMPQRNGDPVNIYEAENDSGMARSLNKMQTVPHLETIKKENTKKPWSGVKQKSAQQYHPPKPSFEVLGDENAQPEPVSSVTFLNALMPIKKDDGFHCPIAIFEVPNPNQRRIYPKPQVYAGGTEYSIEELRAVKYIKRKETRNRDSPDAVKREITACTPSNRAELENPTHRSTDLSENSSANTSKKESNSSSYVENFVFQQMQQSSALGNNCVNDCSLGYKKLPEQQSQPNNQNRHCVDGPRYTNSNVSYQAEINNLSAFGSSVALQPVAQHVDGNCVAENVNHTDVSTSQNKEDMPCSENTDSILSSKKPNSCMAENKKQNLNNQGEFPVKGDGFSVFTTEDSQETVSTADFFTSLNKEEIPHPENADIMLLSNEPHSWTNSLLVVENGQQKVCNQDLFPVEGSDFVTTTGAAETVKAGYNSTYSRKEEAVSRSDHTNKLLLNKAEGLTSPVLIQGNENKQYGEIQEGTTSVNGNCNRQFPIFNDGDTCHTTGRAGLHTTEQEHGFSGFPNTNKNLFSHSVLCGPNKQLCEDVRSFSSTTKKSKVAPFPLFIDNEVPAENEPCASKRELFKSVAREPSDKLCGADSKENMALLSTYMPTNRPAATKREVKLWENVVTASMLKIRRKKASEQMQEPDPQESEKVIPETVVPKKPEGCALTSMSANSEEVLQVINECWASPPKSKKDSGNELSPELHEQPEDIDFQNSPLLKMPAALTGGTGVFLNNKENALPQSTKQKENSEFANSPTLCFGDYMLPEPRALDDTCCSLMFSKTLISSTPNRKSGGPLSSDSSDTSPPDSQEFKIPRRYTPLRAEGFGIMQQPGLLSVIMESSKENKSQSSSGSSSGGRATHHTALSLVSPQTENTPSVLEMQPTYEAHVLKARSLSPLYEGNSSI